MQSEHGDNEQSLRVANAQHPQRLEFLLHGGDGPAKVDLPCDNDLPDHVDQKPDREYVEHGCRYGELRHADVVAKKASEQNHACQREEHF